MCEKTFELESLGDEREAYEVEQHLLGFPPVNDVSANFIEQTIKVDWDEESLSESEIVQELEDVGCKVGSGGLFNSIARRLV